MRVAVDAMGGDLGPQVIIQGAMEGLRFLAEDDELLLYGLPETLEAQRKELGIADPRVKFVPCAEVIGMDDPPVEAVRQKRNSSMMQMARAAGKGEADAVISAGNTGAFAAACQLRIRPIEGITRPGICVVLPTFHGPVLLCDAGANVAPKPRHLYEYAHMGACYAKALFGVENPRIGLVSIGEEEVKGNQLVKEARSLIKNDDSLRFVGNVEGRDMFGGAAEVFVCDGFVGNVILKLTEGLAEGLFKTIYREIAEESEELLERFQPIVERIWKRHDFKEYGGAPLLGLSAIAIICHGRSDQRAIHNAIRVAVEQYRSNLIPTIADRMSEHPEDNAQ